MIDRFAVEAVMTMTIGSESVRSQTLHSEEATAVAAVRGGDRDAFADLCERYRRQLHVHCYRMLGSGDDADDLVQGTFLKAWQARASFEGRSLFRTWLYRIATNSCLDAASRRPRRVMPPDVQPPERSLGGELPPSVDLPWLQPYPDRLLDVAAPAHEEPAVIVESRRDPECSERNRERANGGDELRQPVEPSGPRLERLEERVDPISDPVQPARRPPSS